jgi:shikimate kinase
MIWNRQTIVLVGIMGCGKTRVGSALSAILQLPFVDSDQEIECASNYSVSDIFEKFGESEFRLRERQIMLRLLDNEPKIIASGGGSFIQDEIRFSIKEKAISVWLKPNINVLVERNKRNNKRPMLQNTTDVETRLRELMDMRYPVYAEADITIITDGQTPHDTARLIQMEIDRHISRKGNAAVRI